MMDWNLCDSECIVYLTDHIFILPCKNINLVEKVCVKKSAFVIHFLIYLDPLPLKFGTI